VLGITGAQLRTALVGNGAGWDDDGTFVDSGQSAGYDDGPLTVNERLGYEAERFMMKQLPVLPKRYRDEYKGIDRLYRMVLQDAAVLEIYSNTHAPRLLLNQRAMALQASVDILFDNRTLERTYAGLDGNPLPALAEIVDANRGRDDFELILWGAALAVGGTK
jgi:DNA-directed RNA polymerase beta' subunit